MYSRDRLLQFYLRVANTCSHFYRNATVAVPEDVEYVERCLRGLFLESDPRAICIHYLSCGEVLGSCLANSRGRQCEVVAPGILVYGLLKRDAIPVGDRLQALQLRFAGRGADLRGRRLRQGCLVVSRILSVEFTDCYCDQGPPRMVSAMSNDLGPVTLLPVMTLFPLERNPSLRSYSGGIDSIAWLQFPGSVQPT